MKGLKLCLIGLGLVILSGALFADHTSLLQPLDPYLVCAAGVVLMICGYRKDE